MAQARVDAAPGLEVVMWRKDRDEDLNATLSALAVPHYRDTLSRLEAENIERAIRQLVSAIHTGSHFSSNPDSPFDRLEQTTKKMKANTQILAIRGDLAAHVRNVHERVERRAEDQPATSLVAAYVKQIDAVIDCVERELR